MAFLTEERYQTILDILGREEIVKVSDLSARFDVSIETIRRDLKCLEDQKLLRRVHGGAVKTVPTAAITYREERQVKCWDEKLELGETACSLVREGQVVAMDASTTNHAAAIALKKNFHSLTVITNYLPIINELSQKQGFTLLIPGGVCRFGELSIIGSIAEENMDTLHADIGFISMSGVSLSGGLTDFGIDEIAIKKKIMKNAAVNYVLADSSKFEQISMIRIGPLQMVQGLVTDAQLSAEIEQRYLKEKIAIIHK